MFVFCIIWLKNWAQWNKPLLSFSNFKGSSKMQTHTMAVPAQNISSVVIFRDLFSSIPIWSLFAKIEFGVIRILKFSILISIFLNFYLIRLDLPSLGNQMIPNSIQFLILQLSKWQIVIKQKLHDISALIFCSIDMFDLIFSNNTHKTNAFLIKPTAAGLPPFCLLPFSHLFC